MNETQDVATCGWAKLFHPKGPQVTLPVTDVSPAGSLAQITAFLDAGWLATAPGLEDGEEKETVGYVLRGGFEKEGEITPFVLLYAANDALTWSFLKVYLNKKEDVAAFEYASKTKLSDLPDYVGNDKPQRGASAKTDKFIVPTKQFVVVFRNNPKHDKTEEGKMKPARLFVRWADQMPKTETPAENLPNNRLQLERDVQDLLVKQGKSLAGLMSWLKVPDVHNTKISALTNEQLESARKKLQGQAA